MSVESAMSANKTNYLNDIEHFSSLQPPLCPNELEVQIYTAYCKDRTTLLLGKQN